MRWKRIAGAALAGMLAVHGLHVSPASAGSSRANHLRETGCRDVTGGAARYERERVVHGVPISDADYPDELKQDRGRLTASLHLAEPSCSTVDYLMHVFRPDGSLLLSRVVAGVSGLDRVDFSVAVLDYDENCMAVQFVTRVGDVLVDLAPDALMTYDTVCDGYSAAVVYA